MVVNELLYVRFIGKTASFRIPTLISGVQLSTEIPSYATIIGLLSNILGRKYDPSGKGIGIKYTYQASNLDLETTHRWQRDSKSGNITYNKTNPRKRQIHYHPLLEVFLTDLDLEEELLRPKRVPALGRSQDLTRIDLVKRIPVTPVTKGKVSSTLIPLSLTYDKGSEGQKVALQQSIISGVMYLLPTDFDVSELGKVRIPQGFQMFFALPTHNQTIIAPPNSLFNYKKQDIEPPNNYPWNEEELTTFIYWYYS